MSEQAYFEEIIEELKENPVEKKKLNSLKVELCRKHGVKKLPTDIEILMHAKEEDLPKLKFLQTKPVRTSSGVAVVALMSYPFPCPHGACTMCPTMVQKGVPMSYTGREPSTMRGLRNQYDSYLITMNRLEQYALLGHNFEKVEIIVMGGTFLSYDKKYQEDFIKYTYKAMNDFSELFFIDGKLDLEKFRDFFELPGNVGDKEREKKIQEKILKLKGECSLEEEKTRNEIAKVRCVAMCLETKPDWGFAKDGNLALTYGATRMEIGVQSIRDDVLELIHRGHTIKDTIKCVRDLKDLGFKLNYHWMPGLPGMKEENEVGDFKELFDNPDFRPDMLKIYPCLVVRESQLYQNYLKGEFQPMKTKAAVEIIAKSKEYVPYYCRISRVQRDIPTYMTVAGVDRTNLRQYIMDKMKENGTSCKCIRCREVGLQKAKEHDEPQLFVDEYEASKGKEFFISFEDKERKTLFGYCRLRFPSQQLREEITSTSALIRELHVFGKAVGIGDEGDVQHKGLGKKLLQKAEEIVKEHTKDKILIISGVGVRKYYENLGYSLEGPYMIKEV